MDNQIDFDDLRKTLMAARILNESKTYQES